MLSSLQVEHFAEQRVQFLRVSVRDSSELPLFDLLRQLFLVVGSKWRAEQEKSRKKYQSESTNSCWGNQLKQRS